MSTEVKAEERVTLHIEGRSQPLECFAPTRILDLPSQWALVLRHPGLGLANIHIEKARRLLSTPEAVEEYLAYGLSPIVARVESVGFDRQCACACPCLVRTALSGLATVRTHSGPSACTCELRDCSCWTK